MSSFFKFSVNILDLDYLSLNLDAFEIKSNLIHWKKYLS